MSIAEGSITKFNNFTLASDIAYSIFENIERDVNGQTAVKKIATGFSEMDKALSGGIYDTELMVLAGRPYIGLTTLAVNILHNVSCVGDKCAVYFSFGDNKEALMKKLLYIIAGIDTKRLKGGELGEWEWKWLVEATELIQKRKIYFDDIPVSDLQDLSERIKFAKENLGAELVIIDCLNSIPSNPKSRYEYVKIADKLKATIVDLRVPVILLVQLKLAYSYQDWRLGIPQIKELNKFGTLLPQSDIVTFLHRDSYYTYTEEDANIADWIIARNKRGVPKTIKLFYKHTMHKFKSFRSCSE